MDREGLADPARISVDVVSSIGVTSGGIWALETRSTRDGGTQAKAACAMQAGARRKRQQWRRRGGER